MPGLPIAEHFNTAGHPIVDVLVREILLCGVTSQRKQFLMRLISDSGRVIRARIVTFSDPWRMQTLH